jgi:uncharacterized protein (TIGR00369 family)
MQIDRARARFERVAFGKFLGVQVVELAHERAVLHLPFRDENANVGGVLHGGATASLMHMAGTLAAWTGLDLDAELFLGTVDFSLQYLAAASREDISAEATVLRRGRDVFFLEATVRRADQRLISKGLMIYRAPQYAGQPMRLYTAATLLPTPPVLAPPEPSPTRGDFGHKLQITTTHQRPGNVHMTMPCTAAHVDEQGNIHAGALASLLDHAGTHAAWSMVKPQGARGATVGMQLSYTSVSHADVIAQAQVQQRSEELFFSLVHITTASTHQLVAMGHVSYRLLETRPS